MTRTRGGLARARAVLHCPAVTLICERAGARTGSSQRPPQPACDVGVQRRPERRLERLPEPPVARGHASSSAHPRVRVLVSSSNVRCAPADCPQREGLRRALRRAERVLGELRRARLENLHVPASFSHGGL